MLIKEYQDFGSKIIKDVVIQEFSLNLKKV